MDGLNALAVLSMEKKPVRESPDFNQSDWKMFMSQRQRGKTKIEKITDVEETESSLILSIEMWVDRSGT